MEKMVVLQLNSKENCLQTLKLTKLTLSLKKVYSYALTIPIDVYDTVGSNGIFGANPSVVKFAGFEIRKTHT